MADQGTPSRDTEEDKGLEPDYDVSEQNGEEQPDEDDLDSSAGSDGAKD